MAKPEDVLAQLKDIHTPAPIQWWPPAPAWYVLVCLILILLFAIFYYCRRKIRANKAKKQALALLMAYKTDYQINKNSQLTSAQITELLKRVALVYYPRIEVASLHGEAWIRFLSQNSKGIDFTEVQSMLLDSPFKQSESIDLKPLIKKAEAWIKQRRKPCSN